MLCEIIEKNMDNIMLLQKKKPCLSVAQTNMFYLL